MMGEAVTCVPTDTAFFDMFQRLRNALYQHSFTTVSADPVSHWAAGQFLRHRATGSQQFEISGQWRAFPLRAECSTSSRPYITGLELRARIDLGLPPAGHVIVMSRVVKAALEKQADDLYRDAVGEVKTTAQELSEEIRWLTMFRSVQWKGVEDRFWQRYAVLTDASDLARRWLDNDALQYLITGTSDAASQVPVMAMLMRGRCYLRLQVNPHAQGADAALALELLTHLGERALELAARPDAQHGSVSSLG